MCLLFPHVPRLSHVLSLVHCGLIEDSRIRGLQNLSFRTQIFFGPPIFFFVTSTKQKKEKKKKNKKVNSFYVFLKLNVRNNAVC